MFGMASLWNRCGWLGLAGAGARLAGVGWVFARLAEVLVFWPGAPQGLF